ncbi:MAG: Gfo/Idh/MocA family oxidoreductase [Kiritimatiellae bacterium]|nr:Gfo/Idh/MocA family oxidoreductase [Kiritimatiellia bacterium]
MSSRLRIGIIGAGGISGQHFAAYAANADKAELVCVADLNLETAQARAREYNVPDAVCDYKALLARRDIDAVSICTPTKFHPIIAREAFEAGKHVLSEKPAGLETQPVKAAIAAARQAGKVYAIGFMERQFDTFPALRDAMRAAAIGRPVVARDMAYVGMAEFCQWLDADLNGGPFIDGCCHPIDTWSGILESRVTEVYAHGFAASECRFTIPPGRKAAMDTGDAVLRFESGDRGVLTACWALPKLPGAALAPLRAGARYTIVGPKGFLLGGVREDIQMVTEQGESKLVHQDFKKRYSVAHARQVAAFCKAITDGTAPGATGEDGLYALQVTLAILTSMREDRVVRVADM